MSEYLRCDECDEPVQDFTCPTCKKCGAFLPDRITKYKTYDRWYDDDKKRDD